MDLFVENGKKAECARTHEIHKVKVNANEREKGRERENGDSE